MALVISNLFVLFWGSIRPAAECVNVTQVIAKINTFHHFQAFPVGFVAAKPKWLKKMIQYWHGHRKEGNVSCFMCYMGLTWRRACCFCCLPQDQSQTKECTVCHPTEWRYVYIGCCHLDPREVSFLWTTEIWIIDLFGAVVLHEMSCPHQSSIESIRHSAAFRYDL